MLRRRRRWVACFPRAFAGAGFGDFLSRIRSSPTWCRTRPSATLFPSLAVPEGPRRALLHLDPVLQYLNLQLELYPEALEDLVTRHLDEDGDITGVGPAAARAPGSLTNRFEPRPSMKKG